MNNPRTPRFDGVSVLDALAAEIEDAAGQDRATRTKPLLDFYGDRDRVRAVGVASMNRAAEVEGLVTRIGLALSQSMAAQLRTAIRREAEKQKEDLKRSLRIVSEDDDEAPEEIADAIDWLDYPGGVRVPPGWSVDQYTLSRLQLMDGRVQKEHVGSPIVVTRRIEDADDHTWSVELAWRVRGEWSTERVPRSVALDSRSLVKLADQGLPVSSATSRRMVAWLNEIDQDPQLPSTLGSARMGWTGRRRDSFLIGRRSIGDPVAFTPTSPGARQLADSLTPHGTWEGWCETMEGVLDRPGIWLAVYGAVAACLLRPLRAPNFAIDYCGRSGSGKTTALKVGCSTCIQPLNGRGYRSWSSTVAGSESAAGVLCDLPLALNEAQTVPPARRGEAGALLYGLIEGAGRSKGALGRLGLAQVDDWRTVLISSSEEGIRSWAPTDGASARVLEIREPTTASAAQAEALVRGIETHYGHLIPRVVESLAGMPHDEVLEMREAYAARIEKYARTASSDMTRRAAAYMGVLDAAAYHTHEIAHAPKPTVDVLAWIWGQIQQCTGEPDQALRALDTTWAWIEANPNSWCRGDDTKVPPQGWLGWDLSQTDYIAIVPERLIEMLGRAGYGQVDAILRQWRDRGWIKAGEDNRTRVNARISPGRMGSSVRAVALLDTSRTGGVDSEGDAR